MLDALRSRLAALFAVEIPPHSYALLRILLGAVGLVSMLGLTPIGMYWPLDSLAALPSDGFRAVVAERGLGTLAGYALFWGLFVSFSAMIVGLRSDAAVFASFVGLVAQTHWNGLPLSSAHQVMTVLLFCLVWTETGQVWSLDARWAGDKALRPLPAWPLWLMRCQVAIVYLSSGLHKFAYPMWRDGTAVHWALNQRVSPVPVAVAGLGRPARGVSDLEHVAVRAHLLAAGDLPQDAAVGAHRRRRAARRALRHHGTRTVQLPDGGELRLLSRP
jgi:hypothetical protein